MFMKIILSTLLAACGTASTPATTEPPEEQPDDMQLPGPHVKDNVYFCCHDVDHKTKSGDGCVTIGEKEIDRCDTVLFCSEGGTKKDGKVSCF
jgi:hypothetical protein